jgi:hypothetical protein
MIVLGRCPNKEPAAQGQRRKLNEIAAIVLYYRSTDPLQKIPTMDLCRLGHCALVIWMSRMMAASRRKN